MSWKIRHEGSPRSIEGLTLAQVTEGLRDGLWEPTDEVMGPADRQWVALENHPQFAELAADLEPPPPRHQTDESRLDMNPLIDVALVLLIFFILTTTYETIRKVLEMPETTVETAEGKVKAQPAETVREYTIKVEVRRDDRGQPVILVEDERVAEPDLQAALLRWVKTTRKTRLLVDATRAPDVPWGTIVAIQDAARGAQIDGVYFRVQP